MGLWFAAEEEKNNAWCILSCLMPSPLSAVMNPQYVHCLSLPAGLTQAESMHVSAMQGVQPLLLLVMATLT